MAQRSSTRAEPGPDGASPDAAAPAADVAADGAALELVVDAVQAELVADLLWSLGASAVSETAGAHHSVVLVADVAPDLLPAELVAEARSVRVLEPDPVWSTGWHGTARAWQCGEQLLVRPHWVQPGTGRPGPGHDGDRVEVLLDPGAAFGAGSHASTRLALAALEPLAPAARSVLDVGCGTGVLGLAALVLGAGQLVSIDVDPEAVAATTRAVALNGLEPRVQVSCTPLDQVPGAADLVLANLLLPVVEQLGPALVAHVAPDGALVLAGVLTDQRGRATAALSPLVVVDERELDGWWAAVLVHARPTA